MKSRMLRLSDCRVVIMLTALCISSANAVTIDFNSLPSSDNPSITFLTTQGFTFTSGHFHTVDSPGLCAYGGCPAGNGTIYIAEEAGLAGNTEPETLNYSPTGPTGNVGLPITMTRTGLPFMLTAFDGSTLFQDPGTAALEGFPNADIINLQGTGMGGAILNAAFPLSTLGNLETFMLPPQWTNLVSVTFSGSTSSGGTGSFSLDNIVAIPEPATWLLLATGLAGLLGNGRRKRQQ